MICALAFIVVLLQVGFLTVTYKGLRKI